MSLGLEDPGRSRVTRRLRPPPVRLADELFLAAHDHDTGHLRIRLHRSGLELGLAGALLAELVLDRRIDLRQGRIVPVSRTPMDDILSQTVLADVVSELHVAGSPHTVRVWLAYLSHSSVGQVRNRLCFNGVLREDSGRRWWGGPATLYTAVDLTAALGPESAVHSLLTHDHAPDHTPSALAFAAFADACGLLPKITWWHEQRVGLRRRLAVLREQLPRPVRELVDQTQAAVGDAVVGRR
ncbi:MAG: GPP34 family phosphoprotein [Labedaea sp.]